jgi:acid phosphatase type 7
MSAAGHRGTAWPALIACLLLGFGITPGLRAFDPVGLYLTFVSDPARSIVIDWQLTPADGERPLVYWRPLGADSAWHATAAPAHRFPFSDRRIHRAAIDGLTPDTQYEFHFGTDSRVFRFRTLPANFERPLRLVIGGDTRHRKEWMNAVNRQALPLDPDLIIWGGDFSYADGLPAKINNWYEWFESIKETLIDESGRVVPIVGCVGNHEVRNGYWYRPDPRRYALAGDLNALRQSVAPYFFSLMAFPGQPGYGVLDVGDLLSLIMLDTDHLNPVAGAQTEWLKSVIAERSATAWVIPVYHVGAYPSVRDYTARTATAIRHHWLPLFEQHGVRLAFENHDHAYKRTHPLRGGVVVAPAEGITYLGDGAWGVEERIPVDAEASWFLARSAPLRHLIALSITSRHHAEVTVIGEHGTVIDSLVIERSDDPAPTPVAD